MKRVSATVYETHIVNTFELTEEESKLPTSKIEKLIRGYQEEHPQLDLGWNWHISQVIKNHVQVIGVFD